MYETEKKQIREHFTKLIEEIMAMVGKVKYKTIHTMLKFAIKKLE